MTTDENMTPEASAEVRRVLATIRSRAPEGVHGQDEFSQGWRCGLEDIEAWLSPEAVGGEREPICPGCGHEAQIGEVVLPDGPFADAANTDDPSNEGEVSDDADGG